LRDTPQHTHSALHDVQVPSTFFVPSGHEHIQKELIVHQIGVLPAGQGVQTVLVVVVHF
jgi:hypothetical protein